MHVALVGPCSPAAVADLLDSTDRPGARATPGYEGATAVQELAHAFVDAGHECTVVTTGGRTGAGSATFSGHSFRLHLCESRPRPRDYLRDVYRTETAAMATVLGASGAEIVHAHWTYEFELAAQRSGLPHVTTARDAPLTILRHERDAYRLARLGVAWRARPGIRSLIAPSPYLADHWRRQMLYRREIEIIPNLVRILSPASRRKAEVPTIVCVSNASRAKNVERLVRAFGKVRSQVPSTRLRLIGLGLGDSDPLARRIVGEGRASGIDFVGWVDRPSLAGEIASAWCLVHPSFEESFGNTLVEALALGTPVIGGRDSGAVPWVLAEGEAGELVDVRSREAMSRAMVGLLIDGPKAPPPAAATLILSRYSPESVVQRHIDLYQRAAS